MLALRRRVRRQPARKREEPTREESSRMIDWQSYLYFGIVVFWIIIFVVAVVLTRRFLRGVGEPVPNPEEPTTTEVHLPDGTTRTEQGSTTGASGGAH